MNFDKQEILTDFYTANLSRQLSIIGRKEALLGRAKFAILGDGKEIAQIALSKTFRKGDFRSGYYRDQTWMLALGLMTAEQFFAMLYGDTNPERNPHNGGRMMNNHFATPNIDKNGNLLHLTAQYNSSADISCTAGQMPRLAGLALASKLFRENNKLHRFSQLSNKGNEVAFGSIGDSSTSEGHFFEVMNAAAVKQIPLAMSVWDDAWGISVSKKLQTTKGSISELLEGFKKYDNTNGIYIYTAKGWDYPKLIEIYKEGIEKCRKEHVPVLFHIDEMTQPLGHSSSGSHERYKPAERLKWEQEFDPIIKTAKWIVENKIATKTELNEIEKQANNDADKAKQNAWKNFNTPIENKRNELLTIFDKKRCVCPLQKQTKLNEIANKLKSNPQPIHSHCFKAANKVMRYLCTSCPSDKDLKAKLKQWIANETHIKHETYSANLYAEGDKNASKIERVDVLYADDNTEVPGREILQRNFDALFAKHPLLLAFGQDTGKLGGVNQTMAGLQEKYGVHRIFDSGIRETTIVGKAIGLAMRGFRPIAEIQYFDYILYGLQTLSDDAATVRYRTNGRQKAPVIISTRGHRLEGIWHSGSPMGMVINSIRGMNICVPRNLTKAAAFYNTLLETDDPALLVEPLNAYRIRERLPKNFGEFREPLGKVEVLLQGKDVTIVTYGACVRIAEEAIEELKNFDISCELIDVQTLIPFDTDKRIVESLKKTNRIIFFDEDVPGGATAYMMQKVLEEQNGYFELDSEPKTLTAKEHRPAYSSDGDYFSNPNAEDLFAIVYLIMNEVNPKKYSEL